MNNTLQGLNVLVTRPGEPGDHLCKMIEQNGGQADHFPTIAFAPPPDKTAFEQGIAALGEQDWIIFVSPYAVRVSIPSIRKAWPVFPPHTQFAAVGAITAAALREAGYEAIYPHHDWSSEALIAMPEFQHLQDKKVAIIRGEGGRDVLEQELAERGARILSVVAYKRTLPLPSTTENKGLDRLDNDEIDAIVCASFESIQNLKIILGETGWPRIKNIPLVVVSERIKTLAQALGFQTIWVANNASHQAIIDILSARGSSQ